MSLNTKEFTAEVNAAIDVMEKEEGDNAQDLSALEKGADGKELDKTPDGDASAKGGDGIPADEKAEEGEGDAEASKDKDVEGDGLSREAGDQKADGDSGKASASKKVAPPTISDSAIEQAVRAGISIADAKAFVDEGSLLRVASVMQRSREREVAPEKKEEKREAGGLDELIAAIPTLDPEEFQPEVIAMFDTLKGIIEQQQSSIKEIHEQQTVAENARYEVSAREVEVWFDSEVESLGKDFAEALGEGGYGNLSKGSSQLEKRDQIAEQMSVMMAGYAASGIRTPARSEIFKTAARNVLPGEFDELRNKNVADKLAKRSTQHTQRAAGRKTQSHLSPEEETAQLLDQKYK